MRQAQRNSGTATTYARLVTVAALSLGTPATTAMAGDWWATVPAPSATPAEVIGGYDRGCVAGAIALPATGEGYQVMRLLRQRFYGHPSLVQFVESLAAQLQALGHPGLLVGDLAQPRGGPMPSGHRSHQSGLDVDIWFMPQPSRVLGNDERESVSAVSIVAEGGQTVNENWTGWQAQALQTAATAAEVDRIFVHAAIKRALCDEAGSDAPWLGKLRPWWGHDAHFHVRLHCPADDRQCVEQPPIAAGSGCDAGLDWWFSEEARAPRPSAPASAPPTVADLPAACHSLFSGG